MLNLLLPECNEDHACCTVGHREDETGCDKCQQTRQTPDLLPCDETVLSAETIKPSSSGKEQLGSPGSSRINGCGNFVLIC